MKTFLPALMIALSLIGMSCEKNELITADNTLESPSLGRGQIGESSGSACIDPYTVRLLIEKDGKNNNYDDHVGNIVIANEGDSIMITYNCINGNTLKEIRIWAGEYNDAPVNNAGHPKFGHFMIAANSIPNLPSYSVKIAKSVMGEDEAGIIIAHAKVFKHNSESSWGEGPQFVEPKGKARYIGYKPCITASGE